MMPRLQPLSVLKPGHVWPVLLMCLALWLAQTIGYLHGLVHTGGHAHAHIEDDLPVPSGSSASAQHSLSHGAEDTWLAKLFVGHDEASSACLTFDQLGHYDALATQVLELPLSLASFQFVAYAGLAVARWHAQFQARGPPFSH